MKNLPVSEKANARKLLLSIEPSLSATVERFGFHSPARDITRKWLDLMTLALLGQPVDERLDELTENVVGILLTSNLPRAAVDAGALGALVTGRIPRPAALTHIRWTGRLAANGMK